MDPSAGNRQDRDQETRPASPPSPEPAAATASGRGGTSRGPCGAARLRSGDRARRRRGRCLARPHAGPLKDPGWWRGSSLQPADRMGQFLSGNHRLHCGDTPGHRRDRGGPAGEEARRRARRMLDWLVSIQLPEGGFQGGTIDHAPVVPVTFNTGQVLLGLAAGVEEFGEAYIEPMRRAADWLVATQDRDGCWRRHPSPFAAPGEKTYETHVAWGLLEADRVGRISVTENRPSRTSAGPWASRGRTAGSTTAASTIRRGRSPTRSATPCVGSSKDIGLHATRPC